MIYDIVVSGPVGLTGMLALVQNSRAALDERYSPRYIDKAIKAAEEISVLPQLKAELIYEIRDGGIYAALWETAKELHCGLRVSLYDIPLRQDTIEICNTLDADPYTLDSKGQYLIYVQNGLSAVEELKASGFKDAALAGHSTGDKKRLIIYGDVERFLTPPERG